MNACSPAREILDDWFAFTTQPIVALTSGGRPVRPELKRIRRETL